MLRRALRASLDRIDRCWAELRAPSSTGAPHLVVALFHELHRTRAEARTSTLAPNQELTLEDLRRFLDAMLQAGYTVVGSDDLAQHCAAAQGKLLVLTFDDGYYNNTWALPVLEEFHAAATFFICTNHVLSGKAFWWDVVARRLAQAGKSRREIERTLAAMKADPVACTERRLLREFGSAALKPTGDIDRPFEAGELRDFARSKWVHLGNHTAQHTILTQCSADEAAREIRSARDDLKAITGIDCRAIAYPNGNFSASVVEAARSQGHDIGFTCAPKANAAAFDARAMLTLGRHLIAGNGDYEALVPQLAATFLPGASLRAAFRQLG